MQECCEIIGHHGTTQDIAKKIMETSFVSDPRKIGWLGTGNYFYDDDPLMAKKYSLKRFKHSISCVLECRIVIPKELEFDVTDPKSDDTSLFHKTRKKLIEELIKKNRLNLTTRNSNDFDGKIYNFICNNSTFAP
ncbi:hypothetical protein [Sporolactobacillus nakayamae]|uniref:PARP catalytic domain-containing protein n=1 Tax=Sporolactobacillus nakayamae TaxID=269670 RepID=A0A1I2W5A1_9BACL|nr:hypothetical protein [Sporolactobacillus nakayamae]SFG96570.1 hypothetical protein SAMN02982927_03411 [Sporolactobacillus nakayamae]